MLTRIAATMTRTLCVALCAALVLSLAGSGCSRKTRHRVTVAYDVGAAQGGVTASAFQTLADYLNHPTVQLLLDHMNTWIGDTPPEVAGTYDAFGGIADTTIPGTDIGDAVTAAFCFGLRAGGILEVRVLDPTVEDAGAISFIEGSGDAFTVYTAFRSVQPLPDGSVCEVHEVNIFAGRLEPDGSLVDLEIGVAIVGLIGVCNPFLVGDVQISRLAAALVGPACSTPPVGPQDGSLVQVNVENLLLNDILLFDDPLPQALALTNVSPLGTSFLELAPGFELDFESVPPLAGQDDQGNDLFSGEIVAGYFPADITPAGGSVTYVIESLVGDDEFFAPRPFNSTGEDIFAVTNMGVDIPGYPEPVGSGLDCYCSMPPSGPGDGPYDIGYYSYSAPGIITPAQANVHFFFTSDGAEILPPFVGADLQPQIGSGAVLLDVIVPAP